MLAERFLSSYAAANPDAAILRRDLMRDRLEPQYPEVLACRDALAAAGKLDDSLFADAWQFARADRIVLAAPFWELSFPAILKIYLERVSMRDITFGYEESGLVGRCRWKSCCSSPRAAGITPCRKRNGWRWARASSRRCAPCSASRNLSCSVPRGLDDERVDARKHGWTRPLPAPTRWERPFDAKEEKAAAFSSPYYSSSESCSRSSPLGSMPNSLGRKRGQTFSDVQMTDAASRVPISQASAIVLP